MSKFDKITALAKIFFIFLTNFNFYFFINRNNKYIIMILVPATELYGVFVKKDLCCCS